MENIVEISFLVATLMAFLAYLWHRSNTSDIFQTIPTMKAVTFFGHLHYFLIPAYKGAGQMTTFVHVLYSMSKLFKNEDMFYVKFAHKKLVVLTSAESAQVLLKNKEELNKSTFYRPVKKCLGDNIFVSSGNKSYFTKRKLLSAVFSNSNMKAHNLTMRVHALELINRLKEMEDISRVDVTPLITKFTFDVALDLCICNDNNIKECDKEILLEYIERLSGILGDRMFKPWLHSNIAFNATKLGKEFRTKLSYGLKLAEQFYEQFGKAGDFSMEKLAPYSMLDLMMSSPETRKNWNSPNDLIGDGIIVIFAAFDTNRNVLEWVLFMVGHYPHVQEKIQQELEEVLGPADVAEDNLTWDNISKLRYLKCVIKEAMRLHSSVPTIGRNLKKDMNILGKTIPRGTEVAVLLQAIHRNERYFKNPDSFVPERFEDSEEDIHPYAYIPFSAGMRSCFGPAFGYKTMMTIMAHILVRFHVKSVDPEESMCYKTSILQRAHKHILLNLQRRQ